ncbi:C40 family peptidase [Rhodococcus sp. MS13]|uniref:C40 family peptidase n=1 Tax=Rhodococcus sp. MS13 TaxID=2579940 RepID=UPI0015621A86|nr:C40 family peptidase [Rhodococcus sp. MS13]NRH31122.1 NlpC/P60 family protein [Rhodococcus sp. MS13]
MGARTAVPVAFAAGSADAQVLDVPGVDSAGSQLAPDLWAGLLAGIKPFITPAPLPANTAAREESPIVGLAVEEAPTPAASHGEQALAAAESKLGVPYAWGATGPDSFDCSGLTQWAYRQAGVEIPRTTYAQSAGSIPVEEARLQPGDLVLFYGGEHVGIYAGNGEVVHAPTSGQLVKRAPIDSMPFYAARRY